MSGSQWDASTWGSGLSMGPRKGSGKSTNTSKLYTKFNALVWMNEQMCEGQRQKKGEEREVWGGVHAQTHTPIFLERLSVPFSKDSKNNLRPSKHLSSHSKGKKWIWEQDHMLSGTGNPKATEEDAGAPQLSHCTTSHFQSGKLQALAVSGRNVGKLHPSFRHT